MKSISMLKEVSLWRKLFFRYEYPYEHTENICSSVSPHLLSLPTYFNISYVEVILPREPRRSIVDGAE